MPGSLVRVHQLQILRDELISTRPPAAYRDPSARGRLFPWRWRRAFPRRRRRSLVRHRAGAENVADDALDPAAKSGEAETTRARVSAMCSQVQASALKPASCLSGWRRAGATGWTQPHIDIVERAVVGPAGQRTDQPLSQAREILRTIELALTVRLLGVPRRNRRSGSDRDRGRGHFAPPSLPMASTAVCSPRMRP